eukprot:5927095-Pyramimonas_sp.AAC.1
MLHRRSGGRSEVGDSVPVLVDTAYILRDEDTCSSNSRYCASEDRDLHGWPQRSARYLAASGPLPNLRAVHIGRFPKGTHYWSHAGKNLAVQDPSQTPPGILVHRP